MNCKAIGHEKLVSPDYDYARLLNKEAAAVQAAMGAEIPNPAYTRRPDDRPWLERHNWVLGGALLLAVAGMGMLGLRG